MDREESSKQQAPGPFTSTGNYDASDPSFIQILGAEVLENGTEVQQQMASQRGDGSEGGRPQ